LRTPVIAALVVLVGGLLITSIEIRRLAGAQSIEAGRRLDRIGARTAADITARMSAYEQMLRGARGMIVAVGVENINRRLFRTYCEAQNFTVQYPGLDGIGLIRSLDPVNEAAFFAEVQKDGWPKGLGREAAAPGVDRYLVRLIEPEQSNADLLGFDFANDAEARLAAEQSVRSAEATLSGTTTLSRGGKPGRPSILMLLPVYGSGAGERGVRVADASTIFGWVYASIPIEAFRRTLDSSDGDFSVSLRDVTNPAPHALHSPAVSESVPATLFESRVLLPLYGRNWEVAVGARPGFLERYSQRGPREVLLTGSALMTLLSILMLFYIQRHRLREVSTPRRLEPPQNDLHTVLDAVPAMIAYWDKQLINRFANRASENWFGAEPGALRGKRLRELLGDEQFDRDRDYIESALHGEPQTFEQATTKLDGSGYRHSRVHYVPDLLNGRVRGFYVLVYDISELTDNRLKLAGALRENEELLRTLDLHSKVSVTDDKGYITYVNENFCRILGFRRDEVLGRPHSIIKSGLHSREFWAQMWDTIATGQPWRGEICNRAKDGTPNWVDAIIAPFLGKDGRILKYVSIGTNISAAKSTERKLRDNEAFLERIGTIAGVGGWEFDLVTRQVAWSPHTYRIYEVALTYVPRADGEILFYAPEARQTIRNALLACEQSGTSWDLELPAVTATGRAIWVRTIGAAEWENGQPRRLIGALQDITARKATEMQLLKAGERFALAADSAGIGVWDRDVASGKLTCDDWMYRIYGIQRSLQCLDIASWTDALHPEDRDRCEAEFAASIRGPDDFDSEFRIVRPNGDIRYVKASSRAIRDADGTSSRTTGVLFDVTEARRREMVARRETASLLRTVLDAASEISIIATDQELTIKVFNAGAERMLGFSSADVVGRETLSRIHDSGDLEACCRTLGVAVDGGVHRIMVDPAMLGISHERIYVSKSGRRITVSLFVTQMQSDEGEVLGYVCVAHDITQQRVDERELRDAIAKADNANSAKSLFLANMSHEIRSPMNAVIGLSYLLRRTRLSGEQSNLLSKIQSASNSLLAIITNILDLSKIEASELLVDSIAFSLPDLLREVAAMIAMQAEAKAIGFRMDASTDLPEALTGDPTRLRQILINLLSNAVRFTGQGGVQFKISRCAAAPGRITLAFAVVDTGIGITPEALDRIFAPFAQADASITRRYGGTGLGLSIVKHLSELLGGTVEVRSALGAGSTFTVALPFLPAALTELSVSREDNRAHIQGELLGVRALVVDDSDINLEVAKRILELDGVEVSVAIDGQTAFERLRAEPEGFDVVFMDIQMPILDGYKATQRIRSELGLVDLPIIAVTAGALSSERRRAESAGMTDFICKPFDGQSLGRVILRHVLPRTGRRTPEPTTAASAPPLDERWPQINGIDTADASARWCGDVALFSAMLARLFEEYSEISYPPSLRDKAEVDLHIRRMHKLRGGACMLGAKTVSGLAEEIEAACVAGNLDQALRPTATLESAMQLLAENAEPVLAAARLRMSQASTLSVEPLSPDAIEELGVLLRQQSLAAVDRFRYLSPQLRNRMGTVLYEQMRLHVDNLQFDDACDDLRLSAARSSVSGDSGASRPMSEAN
jgi:PAS domain S-box-containing protein